MKFTAAAVAALAAGAIAAPQPEANPWCFRPGQPCWKAKRAVDAFAEAIKSSGGLKEPTPEAEFSNLPGGAAFNAKRAVNELANVLALSSDSPEAYYKALGLEKEFEADQGDVKEKREAAPEPWCWREDRQCWKKRDTGDDESVGDDDESVAVKDKRWCFRPGQPCWKAKRAADSVLEAVGKDEDTTAKPFDPVALYNLPAYGPWAKREASPEPWCFRPGQPCWKAKRDIQAIRAVARDITSLE